MKTWTDDNPKAGLLKRKREAILAAARRQFLAHGYGGTSMEAVAADADVSIMTLYRHAESKDDLFAAVVAIACDSHDAAGANDLSKLSLRDILFGTAVGFQEKLSSPETMALLRAVIAEQDRFPDLAGIAFEATVGHLLEVIERILADTPEGRLTAAEDRRRLSRRYSDELFGADTLRLLLGLSGSDPAARQARAARATEELLAGLQRN